MDANEVSAPLRRAVAVLKIVAEAEGGLKPKTLAERVGMPRSSVHRLIHSLRSVGLLALDPDTERLTLGQELVDLVVTGGPPESLADLARPYLAACADQLGEAAFAARLKGTKVEIFAVIPPSDPAAPYVSPGFGLRPAHACSSAKAILAFQDETIVDACLGEFVAFTTKTHRARSSLFAELERIRADGYAECQEETVEGIYSIAVPVRPARGAVKLSIGIVGPFQTMRRKQLDGVVAALNQSASRFSQRLSGPDRSSHRIGKAG